MKFSRKAKRELFLILLFVVSVPFMYLLLFGQGGFIQLGGYRTQLLELQKANQRLLEENQRILDKIQRLKADPREIERIAREDYNMARPGDIIITLPEE